MFPENKVCVTKETHAFVASLAGLQYLQSGVQSTPLSYPVPLCCLRPPRLFPRSCLSQFCFGSWLLSADWLAHLPEDKVPEWGQHAHACTSKPGSTWDHMQTQTCTLRHLAHTNPTHTHTHTAVQIWSTHTHTQALTSKVLQRHAFPPYTW